MVVCGQLDQVVGEADSLLFCCSKVTVVIDCNQTMLI